MERRRLLWMALFLFIARPLAAAAPPATGSTEYAVFNGDPMLNAYDRFWSDPTDPLNNSDVSQVESMGKLLAQLVQLKPTLFLTFNASDARATLGTFKMQVMIGSAAAAAITGALASGQLQIVEVSSLWSPGGNYDVWIRDYWIGQGGQTLYRSSPGNSATNRRRAVAAEVAGLLGLAVDDLQSVNEGGNLLIAASPTAGTTYCLTTSMTVDPSRCPTGATCALSSFTYAFGCDEVTVLRRLSPSVEPVGHVDMFVNKTPAGLVVGQITAEELAAFSAEVSDLTYRTLAMQLMADLEASAAQLSDLGFTVRRMPLPLIVNPWVAGAALFLPPLVNAVGYQSPDGGTRYLVAITSGAPTDGCTLGAALCGAAASGLTRLVAYESEAMASYLSWGGTQPVAIPWSHFASLEGGTHCSTNELTGILATPTPTPTPTGSSTPSPTDVPTMLPLWTPTDGAPPPPTAAPTDLASPGVTPPPTFAPTSP